MKRLLLIAIVLIVMLTGCLGGETAPKKGDFSFELPDGYSVSNVTDENCSIVCDGDGAEIGGIEVTGLKSRDLTDSGSTNIMKYLQDQFHKTNNIEFIASHWGEEHPIVSVNLSKTDDATEEKTDYSHFFFEKNSIVYHLWLVHLDGLDGELADQFLFVADPK